MSGRADLAGMNLNQLVALDALLGELNVRRAAARMGVTQSAMSHTLRGLRALFEDPLLVRVGNRMVPTERAQQIAGSLRRGLSELEAVVRGRAAFTPESIRDEFSLMVDGSTASMLLGPLYAGLRAEAPHARLKIAPIDEAGLHARLVRGDVDLALLPPLLDLSGLETEPLMGSEVSVLMCAEHPRIRRRVTLDAYCACPHAMISLTGEGRGMVDELLAPLGRTRTVAVKVPHLFALPELLPGTELLATVPAPAARYLCDRWPLRSLPLPFATQVAPVFLCWHARYAADPANAFFRDQVRRAIAELQATRGTAATTHGRRELRTRRAQR